MKILVIAAHPDDEVLGMGGTIKKYTKSKNEVKILIMATGIHSRRSSNFHNKDIFNISDKTIKKMDKQVETIKKHAIKSAKLLGVKNIEFAGFPDNEMDTISNLEITKTIEKNINDFNPDIVYTHSQFDLNVDHRVCYNATLTATRPIKNQCVKEVISFEIPSSTEWNFPSKFSPNLFIDISNEIDSKIKSMKCYKTEIMPFPHPRSAKGIRITSEHWGMTSGYKNSEAFTIIRKLSGKI